MYSPVEGIVAADECFSSIVEREHNALIGLTMEELTHSDDAGANRWLMDQALRTGVPFVLRKRYVYENRPPQWVENRYSVAQAGSRGPLLLALSRKVEEGHASQGAVDFEVASYKSYIRNLVLGLADMARMSGHVLATDLLASAAQVIEDEDA
ncbi:MAG: hypothetical protein ACYDD1_01195 [Caulobacteraceae bacterium]